MGTAGLFLEEITELKDSRGVMRVPLFSHTPHQALVNPLTTLTTLTTNLTLPHSRSNSLGPGPCALSILQAPRLWPRQVPHSVTHCHTEHFQESHNRR